MKITLTQVLAGEDVTSGNVPLSASVVPGPILVLAVPGSIRGPAGPQGPPGPPGPPGLYGAFTYTFTQALPATTWVIAHGLGRYPAVDIIDSTGRLVDGDVVYDSANQVTVTFTAGFAGLAYLN